MKLGSSHISRSDAEFLTSIRRSPIASVITDPRLKDNPIVAVNKAFCRLTGYSPSEACGRNCRFLAGEETDAWSSAILRDAVVNARPALTELLNHRRDGTLFRNAVMIAPVFDEEGRLAYFLGSQMDVTDDAKLPSVVRREQAAKAVAGLTPRQREVLREMTLGYRNKQIADHLGVSEKTVKMHRGAMIGNLGIATSADAIRIAVEAGL